MKKEKVIIYQDSEFRKEFSGKIMEAIQQTEKAAKLFEQITGEPVTQENFECFMKRPDKLAKEIFQSKVIIPEGLNRDKYLEMIEYPNFTELGSILTFEYCSPVFIKWDGEKSQPDLTDKAFEVASVRDIELEKGSSKLEAWEAFKSYIDSLNRMHKLTGSFHDFTNIGSLYTMADPVYCERGINVIGYKANPVKFTGKYSNL